MWRQHHRLLKRVEQDGKKGNRTTRFIEGEVEKKLRFECIEGIEYSIPIITPIKEVYSNNQFYVEGE